jgi:hypothetical protein
MQVSEASESENRDVFFSLERQSLSYRGADFGKIINQESCFFLYEVRLGLLWEKREKDAFFPDLCNRMADLFRIFAEKI